MAKILVVDDYEATRRFVKTAFRASGHSVVEASNGLEALRVAREERPDLVITDIRMPVMSGWDFVRQLREDAEIGKTPVVFYTVYDNPHERAQAMKLGIIRFFEGPVDVRHFTAEIETILESVKGES